MSRRKHYLLLKLLAKRSKTSFSDLENLCYKVFHQQYALLFSSYHPVSAMTKALLLPIILLGETSTVVCGTLITFFVKPAWKSGTHAEHNSFQAQEYQGNVVQLVRSESRVLLSCILLLRKFLSSWLLFYTIHGCM